VSAVVRDDPVLRRMGAEHVDAVHAIENAAYEFPWSLGVFSDCLKVGYSCWVMEEPGGDGVIGYGILSLGAGEGHILNLCTDPTRQQRGHGRAMLMHLLEVAEAHGAIEIFLEVRPSNHQALRMYLSSGFNEIGRRQGYYPAKKGREDALVLAKRLGL